MTPDGLALLKQFEGFRGDPYRDAVGVLTVGYGTTLPLSEIEASWLMEARAETFERQVATAVERQLSPTQLDALTSFAYNVGFRAFQHSTLLAKIIDGDLEAVPDELRKWTHAGGRVLLGLVARREAEIALWNQSSADGTIRRI
jgi:lysozyme